MKSIVILLTALLIGNLLPAQNVKVDVVPQNFSVGTDSLVLSMNLSVNIENMDAKSSIMLIPVLTGRSRNVQLPHILLNGKQKQKLLLRNQILRKKNEQTEDKTVYLTAGINEKDSRSIPYRTSLPAESWMNEATLTLRRCIIRPQGEQYLKDTLIIYPNGTTAFATIQDQSSVAPPTTNEQPFTPESSAMKYKGSYIFPESDDMDARNQKELNFSLEEAKMMATINPQMLSLRELYTVALSYTEDKAQFYRIINTSVKLYPVHPIANLNAAAAAIEQGDVKAAGKFLPMAPRDSLAYKNCRGAYELMTGNTYEGIRVLKAAKAEGSEEASYNLNVFFTSNKRQ